MHLNKLFSSQFYCASKLTTIWTPEAQSFFFFF